MYVGVNRSMAGGLMLYGHLIELTGLNMSRFISQAGLGGGNSFGLPCSSARCAW